MPKVVVAAVDDSQDSQQAVSWLESFFPQHELRVLMCVPQKQGDYGSGVLRQLEAARQACKSRFPRQAGEVVLVPVASSEAIGAAILKHAQTLHAVLLAIAPHARTTTQRVLHGSVTDYVCRHSRLPVLVVQGVAGNGSGGGGGRVSVAAVPSGAAGAKPYAPTTPGVAGPS